MPYLILFGDLKITESTDSRSYKYPSIFRKDSVTSIQVVWIDSTAMAILLVMEFGRQMNELCFTGFWLCFQPFSSRSNILRTGEIEFNFNIPWIVFSILFYFFSLHVKLNENTVEEAQRQKKDDYIFVCGSIEEWSLRNELESTMNSSLSNEIKVCDYYFIVHNPVHKVEKSWAKF